ncbi:MAG: CinA family protein [Akkermansiaceae bacterium]|nr:CinA family protein [Akkermansiaceae bacterium]
MNADLELAAFAAVNNLRAAGLSVATAESCTGGLIAAAITGVPGASAVFRYGWVTYCNAAKERELGVLPAVIEQHGVVSEQVVAAMALGAMRKAGADFAVAVSGNAGPSAAEGEPPAGTVCLALARRGAARPVHTETLFRPELPRNALRAYVAARALHLLASSAQG